MLKDETGTWETDVDEETRCIAEEAADWYERLKDPSDDVREGFAEWLTASPLHIEEFLRMCMLSRELEALASRKSLSSVEPSQAQDRADEFIQTARMSFLEAGTDAPVHDDNVIESVRSQQESASVDAAACREWGPAEPDFTLTSANMPVAFVEVKQSPAPPKRPRRRGSHKGRLHVPGGLYYVVQRGNARQPLFNNADDYRTFEQLLAAMVLRCRTRVHAFYWTRDAIHMAIQIADLPIGRLMQRLTSQYARKLHRKQGVSGHLFQQRYHALLVDPDMYLLKLIRYIHFAPVRAGIAQDPSEYTLSSHNAYLGVTNVPWLSTGVALRTLNPRLEQARIEYRSFMSKASETADADLFDKGCTADPRVLGNREFMQAIPRIQRSYRSPHSLDQVIETVADKLGLERTEVLSRSRQRRLALARALITWFATERGIATLAEVARRLERDPSTLFVAVERYRTLRPELFNIGALHDSGPLLRRVLNLPQSQP